MTKPCGCCDDDGTVPDSHENRPGLSALAYRLGTHPSFLRRMRERLHTQTVEGTRPLAALTTRASDDPAIALLDASAAMLDVLTFYQERIANENYLRTATERRSLLELARAIGYELRPGVAATAYLAFTVEDAKGAPLEASVAQGTQVMSIPAPGQLPQTFETSSVLTARAEFNSLRPRITRPQLLALHNDTLYLYAEDGTLSGAEVEEVDGAIIYGVTATPPAATVQAIPTNRLRLDGGNLNLKTGDALLFVGKRVTNETNEYETLTMVVNGVIALPTENVTEVVVGTAAPTTAPSLGLPTFTILSSYLSSSFNQFAVRSYFGGGAVSEQSAQAIFGANKWQPSEVQTVLTSAPPPPDDAAVGIFALRQRVGVFGVTAPAHDSLPDEMTTGTGAPFAQNWDAGGGWSAWNGYPGNTPYPDNSLYLERTVTDIAVNGWVVVESPGTTRYRAYRVTNVSEQAVTGFALSARTTAVSLDLAGASKPSLSIRTTTVHAPAAPLTAAPLPITDDVAAPDGAGATQLYLQTPVFGLTVGQPLLVTGEPIDTPAITRSEVTFIKSILHLGGTTLIELDERLDHVYRRASMTISANVVAATHGTTVNEVLGSGSATQPNQTFRLRKPPLTYTADETGAATSLSVRVNDLLWEQKSDLYGATANEAIYTVRLADDGAVSVTFGDGEQGARLPTGIENVTATYRSGLGVEGNVGAGSLTLLPIRPYGIRSVVNPVLASGGAAGESRDDARTNAPLSVATLGRVVSLRDYEDFARTYPGIDKAQALLLWHNGQRVVLTVATAAGDPISTAPDLEKNLLAALAAVRDPVLPVSLVDFVPRQIQLHVRLWIDARCRFEDVQSTVQSELLNAFSFTQRIFGQQVTQAEVVSVIHRVAGVVAADIDVLDFDPSATPAAQNILPAESPRSDGVEILPGELLLLNPVGVFIEQAV